MSSTNKKLLLTLFICTVIAACAFFLWQKPSKPPESKKIALVTGAPSGPPPSIQPEKSIALRRSPASRVEAMSKALLAADDLRVFTEMAKQHPEDGGIYLAKTINHYCWDVRQSTASLSKDSPNESHKTAVQRTAAKEKLQRLCGGFLDAEATLGFRDLVKLPAAKKDPLLNAEQFVLESGAIADLEQRKLGVRKLLDYAVPLVIINAPFSGVDGTGGKVFDGKVYGGKTNPEGAAVFQAARFLAACNFGDNCSDSDRMLLVPCASEGLCANNRYEYVSMMFAQEPNGQQRYREALDLSKKIASAIESKDVDIFFKKDTKVH